MFRIVYTILLTLNFANAGVQVCENEFLPLDVVAVKARLSAVTDFSKGDTFIPELRSDVERARKSLPEFEKKMNTGIRAAFAHLKKNKKTILFDPRVTLNLTLAKSQSTFKALNDKLAKWSDPKGPGVPQKEWIAVAQAYVQFATLVENKPEGILNTLRPHSLFDEYAQVVEKTPDHLEDLIVEKLTRAKEKGWDVIPVWRDLSIPEMNDWMSQGLSPLDVRDVPGPIDGYIDLPVERFNHDWAFHLEQYGKLETGLSMSARVYFLAFRDRLAKDQRTADNLQLSKTIEALWFYMYHELVWRKYGPEVLLRIVTRPDVHVAFMERLRSHDIGDYFGQNKPKQEMVALAGVWLEEFAESMLKH